MVAADNAAAAFNKKSNFLQKEIRWPIRWLPKRISSVSAPIRRKVIQKPLQESPIEKYLVSQ